MTLTIIPWWAARSPMWVPAAIATAAATTTAAAAVSPSASTAVPSPPVMAGVVTSRPDAAWMTG